MEDALYNDILVELECPICTKYMSPPIRQCVTGHSVCESCRNKLPKCALCQGVFTESRNISLEGLAMKMRYPCINKSEGCTAVLNYNNREEHESNCIFKWFHCPMEKCSWVGQYNDIRSHWASKKVSSKPYQANNLCYTRMKLESYYVNIVEAYDHLFWFKCRLMNKKLYWAVQYIGKPSDAQNFYYEIEIFRQGRTKRKILLSDYCQSIEIDNSELFKEISCIWMHSDVVDHFVCDEQLMYYMRIHPIKNSTQKTDISKAVMDEKRHRDRSRGPQVQIKNKDFKLKKSPKGKSQQTNDEVYVGIP